MFSAAEARFRFQGSTHLYRRIIPERKNKFLDVFGGGGSVSLSGKYAPLQIYNDYNPHLANFMRILKSRSEELIDKLTGAYNSDGTLNENFERTFFINSRDSFNACSNVFHKGDTWEKLFDANLKIQLKAASLAEKEHAWSIVLDRRCTFLLPYEMQLFRNRNKLGL